jgi:hypothetical protein
VLQNRSEKVNELVPEKPEGKWAGQQNRIDFGQQPVPESFMDRVAKSVSKRMNENLPTSDWK